MTGARHDFKGHLARSGAYDFLQWIMGAQRARTIFASRYIRARDGDRILDLGCGTAESRLFLPNVEYWGVDPSSRYIETAQNRLREYPGCTLLCASVDEVDLATMPRFELVLAVGILHHLDDEAAARLANLARAALQPHGRLVTLDACLVDAQSPVARFLIRHDRGEFVRNEAGYRALMAPVFSVIDTEIRHDLNRFPYTHLIMECAVG